MSDRNRRADGRDGALRRLDAFLLGRVFQPTADALGPDTKPADIARFFLIGAMVLLLAGLLASAAERPPEWTVCVDLVALWGGAAMLRTVGDADNGRLNPLRERFGTVRPMMAVLTVAVWAAGATSVEQGLAAMQLTLWCAGLYFASCDAPRRFRSWKKPIGVVGAPALARVRAKR